MPRRRECDIVAACLRASAFFWVFEFLSGNPFNALRHLAAGTRIAKTLKLSNSSGPSGAQYLRSFVKDLPAAVNPEVVARMSRDEQEAQKISQHRYSLGIMLDAVDRLDAFQTKVAAGQSLHKSSAAQIIIRTTAVLEGLVSKWPGPPLANEDGASSEQAVLDNSPFIHIIEDAKMFFEDDDLGYVQELERKLRPAIDFFVWGCASQQLSVRQHLIEIWDMKRPALPLTRLALATDD